MKKLAHRAIEWKKSRAKEWKAFNGEIVGRK
jgi:hypothetical protein